MRHITPLRYPGGKAALGEFFGRLIETNRLSDGVYVEPFAGGAGVAMHLLLGEYVDGILINDIDPAVRAFWESVIRHNVEFCRLIETVPLTVSEWEKQKATLAAGKANDVLVLGFAMFYLNRTNRSGILNGGVIGGKRQDGQWRIDARFNRKELAERIRRIGRYQSRIQVANEDALDFLRGTVTKLPKRSLVYLDPPYYERGQHLYTNFYQHADHVRLAQFVTSTPVPWVTSYDDHDEIRTLYSAFRPTRYRLEYSAHERRKGTELMFFSPGLSIPALGEPRH